jgi:hypothetical protein
MPAADLSAASGLCSPAALSAATRRSAARSPTALGSAALLCKNRNRKQQANRNESDHLLHAASHSQLPAHLSAREREP